MLEYIRRTPMPTSREGLYQWHARRGAFERLIPPWESLSIRAWAGGEATAHLPPPQQVGDISTGTRVTLRTGLGPISTTIVAEHVDHQEGSLFVDEMRKGPFAAWRHAHRFLDGPDGTSILEDHIRYALPLGMLGQALGGGIAKRRLEQMFAFRHRRTAQDLARHARYADTPRMTIAITGASGLIGTQLAAFLRTGGHTIIPLTRRDPPPGSAAVRWDPRGFVDTDSLEGVDAVIHLAGESIQGRWTTAKKERILESRRQGTSTLAHALATMTTPPKTLISSSAIGYYGDRGDERLEADATPGEGFLAEVCQIWESATQPAKDAGIRVVHPRTGVVLSGQGGALKTMLPAFWMGAGGTLGDGAQWMSWIGIDDLIGIFHHVLMEDSVRGPINAVAPNPVTNQDFTTTLGQVLRRPTFVPVPAAAIRFVLGEMGQELLLYSARVQTQTLMESGFSFLQPTLEEALRAELGRS